MRKAKNPNAVKIPRFTINKVTKSNAAVGKLYIPLVELTKLGDALNEAIANAQAGGCKGKTVKGTLTLY